VLIPEKGRLVTALSLAIEDGAIHRMFAVRNPEKLDRMRYRCGGGDDDFVTGA
jgi:hypothetical protein